MKDLYYVAMHRIQTAIAFLMNCDPNYSAVEPKHMRVGIDLSKSDQAGLATLLIEKGIFTKEEYIEAILKSAQQEADAYEAQVQAVIGNRHIRTL